MAKLSDHSSGQIVKLMLLGGSGTGKTGSLTSLVKAGYKLRIIDLDNNLSSLAAYSRRDAADNVKNVEFVTLRDKYKASVAGPVISGQPKAFVDTLLHLNKWTDGTVPGEWGENTVLVIDSLTLLGRAAFEWAKGMNQTAKDKRNWYYAAQQAIENMIAMLTAESFNCNVVVITHVRLQEIEDGSTKGFANAIGSALGPILPAYFGTVLLMQTSQDGKKRTIHTVPTALIDLKNPAPFRVAASYTIETGMAEIFAALKDEQLTGSGQVKAVGA